MENIYDQISALQHQGKTKAEISQLLGIDVDAAIKHFGCVVLELFSQPRAQQFYEKLLKLEKVLDKNLAVKETILARAENLRQETDGK